MKEARIGLRPSGLGALMFPRAPAPEAQTGEFRKRREEIYINTVRLALSERRLTRDEESHLHHHAEELGIGGGRAHERLVQVEREAGERGVA